MILQKAKREVLSTLDIREKFAKRELHRSGTFLFTYVGLSKKHKRTMKTPNSVSMMSNGASEEDVSTRGKAPEAPHLSDANSVPVQPLQHTAEKEQAVSNVRTRPQDSEAKKAMPPPPLPDVNGNYPGAALPALSDSQVAKSNVAGAKRLGMKIKGHPIPKKGALKPVEKVGLKSRNVRAQDPIDKALEMRAARKCKERSEQVAKHARIAPEDQSGASQRSRRSRKKRNQKSVPVQGKVKRRVVIRKRQLKKAAPIFRRYSRRVIFKEGTKLHPLWLKSKSPYLRHEGMKDVVGAGTFGKVYRAQCRWTKRLVAMKELKKEHERDGVSVKCWSCLSVWQLTLSSSLPPWFAKSPSWTSSEEMTTSSG